MDNAIRLSPSIAKILIQESPAHAYAAHSKLGKRPRKDTPSLIKGKLVDRLVFGKGPECWVKGGKGADDVKVCDYVGDGSKLDQPLFVTNTVYQEACDIAQAVLPGLYDRGITVDPALSQQTWLWNSIDQVKCKCIVDLWDGTGNVYDLKTASDMSDEGITRAVEIYGYDIQAAAEVEACRILHGFTPKFKWIFVETGDVNDVRLIEPSQDQLRFGLNKWLQAVNVWRDCLRTDTWPGRPDKVLGPSQYRLANAARSFESEIIKQNQ